MRKVIIFLTIFIVIFSSCSTKNQLVYLKDSDKYLYDKVNFSSSFNTIEVGDILKIDIQTVVPEAAIPYNDLVQKQISSMNLDVLKLQGFLVNDSMTINYPILGNINVNQLSLSELENKIKYLLINGNHLNNPTVKIRRLNSKFTVLGEVRNPGTFSFYEEKLNLFQALGYAGDLTIEGKRNGVLLIREKNGVRSVNKISLTEFDILKKPYYHIKNNDIIIVEPNFSKVKSAGFIGSPQSISSIASLLLSITLLIINN